MEAARDFRGENQAIDDQEDVEEDEDEVVKEQEKTPELAGSAGKLDTSRPNVLTPKTRVMNLICSGTKPGALRAVAWTRRRSRSSP